MAKKWIQKAVSKMKAKGTVGKFGKATAKKIASGKKVGGVEKKRAVFAQNMKKIANENKGKKKPASKGFNPTKYENARKKIFNLN